MSETHIPPPTSCSPELPDTWAAIPDHLKGGLVRYFDDGILPGSFLRAVLANDLRATLASKDFSVEYTDLLTLVLWLVSCAPRDSWRSLAAVDAYARQKERERTGSQTAAEGAQ